MFKKGNEDGKATQFKPGNKLGGRKSEWRLAMEAWFNTVAIEDIPTLAPLLLKHPELKGKVARELGQLGLAVNAFGKNGVEASKALLDRAIGKPTQPVEVTGEDGPLRVTFTAPWLDGQAKPRKSKPPRPNTESTKKKGE